MQNWFAFSDPPVKIRFRGLAKNTAHMVTLFALSNLWMARRQLMTVAEFRPRSA